MTALKSGAIQLGRVSAKAAWKVEEAMMTIRFDAASLPGEATRELEHYRHSSRPLTVKVPAMQGAIPGIVIGYDKSPRFVTFHIAMNGEPVSNPARPAVPVRRTSPR